MSLGFDILNTSCDSAVLPFTPSDKWEGDYYKTLSEQFPHMAEILRFLIVFKQIKYNEIYCFSVYNIKSLKYIFLFPMISKEDIVLSDLIKSMENVAEACNNLSINNIIIPLNTLKLFNIETKLAKSTIDRVFKKHNKINIDLLEEDLLQKI